MKQDIEGHIQDLKDAIPAVEKRNNGEPLSKEDENALEKVTQDHHGENCTEANGTVAELRSHINDYEDRVTELEANIQRRNAPDYEVDEESFLLPIFAGTIFEIPALRTLFLLYSIIKANPLLEMKFYSFYCYCKNHSKTIIMVIVIGILFIIASNLSVLYCDAPRAWGLYFQDSASPQMEALIELHNNIMYYLVGILISVGWVQGAIINNFRSSRSAISNKYLNHGTLIELIWTITPALILVLIAFPSFKLLYLMDEVTDPSLSVVAEGHQWYWSYEYPDFLTSDGDFIEFDSYLVPESDLEKGSLRMLEVDNRVILPEITHTRFILTAADVIHSFAIPALGIKCDAYPGRLNQFSVLINRLGTFYGQCSEICGILHSSMPIVLDSIPLGNFLTWLREQVCLLAIPQVFSNYYKNSTR
jgi:cytochrome c oxidase subunit 2